jgi:1-acyl-sn-glycerol-3-phosphate acyltransferase
MFKRDVFGKINFLKKAIVIVSGYLSFFYLNIINKTKVEGMENLVGLPDNNVLLISNHQTYFMDVIAILHISYSARCGLINNINSLLHFLGRHFLFDKPIFYFIAATDTMKKNLLTRIMSYCGAILIKRTWREGGHEVNRSVDLNDFNKIGAALKAGIVVTFPQGTIKPFAPGRMGTAHIIKEFKPIVIPIVIDGFYTAFGNTGFKILKTGHSLKIKVKAPLEINYDNDACIILEQVINSIEQSEGHKVEVLV